MTQEKLNAILATALDKAGQDTKRAAAIMQRYALIHAFAAEEELSEEDVLLASAAAVLYDLNDESVNPPEGEKEFSPIVITNYIKEILEDVYLPTFEASVIGSLVAMQKHGGKIENNLHRLIQDAITIITLMDEGADSDKAKAARDTLTHDSAKHRLDVLFGL